jgi:hypothetical protein
VGLQLVADPIGTLRLTDYDRGILGVLGMKPSEPIVAVRRAEELVKEKQAEINRLRCLIEEACSLLDSAGLEFSAKKIREQRWPVLKAKL